MILKGSLDSEKQHFITVVLFSLFCFHERIIKGSVKAGEKELRNMIMGILCKARYIKEIRVPFG